MKDLTDNIPALMAELGARAQAASAELAFASAKAKQKAATPGTPREERPRRRWPARRRRHAVRRRRARAAMRASCGNKSAAVRRVYVR